jgi:LuxR family maltose regulon positive regulatory protein
LVSLSSSLCGCLVPPHQKSPTVCDELHLRASAWFENEGSIAEAVNHALAARHWERAAPLMELAGESLRRGGGVATLTSWMQALPDSVRRAHPALCLAYARALGDAARFADAETFIREAEHWLEGHAQVSDTRADSLRGRALALRAQFANTRNEFAQAIELSYRAEQLLAHDDVAWRSWVALNLAGAFRFTSKWAEADMAYREAATLSESTGDYVNALTAPQYARVEVLQAEGRLRQAVQQYEQVLVSLKPGDCKKHRCLATRWLDWAGCSSNGMI